MKLYMKMEKPVTILAKTETPYDFNGNKGVTYRVALLFDGDVEKIKCVSKDVYDSIQINATGILCGILDVRSGSGSDWKVSAFIPQK